MLPRSPRRRRPRRGSLERPVNARLYRGTWLFVALPLLLAAFTVSRPASLPAPALPPTFDAEAAVRSAQELARLHPDRTPGSSGAAAAARWLSSQLAAYGLQTRQQRFSATIPGRGRLQLVNLVATVAGSSPRSIVVMAHRDDAGGGGGADDNASGTGALIELARIYGQLGTSGGRQAPPAHTLVFLSTDGGAYGALGAARFAESRARAADIAAVLNLDSLSGPGPPAMEIAGDTSRSPGGVLLETVREAVFREAAAEARRPSALRQLVDLGFPFSLYEQAPFLARGIPAVTLTTAADRPPSAFGDTADSLSVRSVGRSGRAADRVLASLDAGLEVAGGTSSSLFLGGSLVRGWAVELVLAGSLLPFLTAAVDLFAHCRRRRIRLAPAVRCLRSRLGFWLWVGLVFEALGLAGAWPSGEGRPLAPLSGTAGSWRIWGLIVLTLAAAAGWLLGRERLLPRRPATGEEELAGYTVGLLALALVSLVVLATNPFALLFVLPSLHAWLWLPQMRERPGWARAAIFSCGLAGPLLLLWSFGIRFGLGFDAPWYIAELRAVGYVSLAALVLALAWAGPAAQLAALASGRYAAYPAADARAPRGPLRQAMRSLVLARRRRRRPHADRSAAEL